ncbi:MAG: hypothetical protein NTY00_10080 [Deltaproteobacteria bacterium]|nr:hypothetical protein [Deltaproteobacteria bacterium]MCX5870959.1 hypothetical protein [Deltaproteobacteria bacterium]
MKDTESRGSGNSERIETNADSASSSSSESESGFAKIIGWVIGVVIIILVVVWLAVNIVLPIVLLNSALALTILAVFIKQRKTLFATFALIGGCYMILDVVNGWFSANFVNNVVKNPQWLTGFVYLNAAAVGLSTWLLIEPQWAKAKAAEPYSKQRDNLWLGAVVALVAVAGASLPLVYHNVRNPFSVAAAETITRPDNGVTGQTTTPQPTSPNTTNEGHEFVGTWSVHKVISRPVVDTRTNLTTGKWTETVEPTPLEWSMKIERVGRAFRISGGGREVVARYDGGRLVVDRTDGLTAAVTMIDKSSLRWDFPDDLIVLRRRP